MFAKLKLLLAFVFAGCTSFVSAAEVGSDTAEGLRGEDYTISTITPIFSQLLFHRMPNGFKLVFEDTIRNGAFYIHELVKSGETVENWTQMLTDTGMKDMASNAKVSPQMVAFGIVNAFKKGCPTSFSVLDFGEMKLGEYEAFAVVGGCGISPAASSPRSESALIVAIKGEKDYYTVQGAERGAWSITPIALDKAMWDDRLQKFLPIKLCPIPPGEKAPYPSCIGH